MEKRGVSLRCLHKMCGKGSVSQDFWPLFFHDLNWFGPLISDKHANVFSNSASILSRYSITNSTFFTLLCAWLRSMMHSADLSSRCASDSMVWCTQWSLTLRCDARRGIKLRVVQHTTEQNLVVDLQSNFDSEVHTAVSNFVNCVIEYLDKIEAKFENTLAKKYKSVLFPAIHVTTCNYCFNFLDLLDIFALLVSNFQCSFLSNTLICHDSVSLLIFFDFLLT